MSRHTGPAPAEEDGGDGFHVLVFGTNVPGLRTASGDRSVPLPVERHLLRRIPGMLRRGSRRPPLGRRGCLPDDHAGPGSQARVLPWREMVACAAVRPTASPRARGPFRRPERVFPAPEALSGAQNAILRRQRPSLAPRTRLARARGVLRLLEDDWPGPEALFDSQKTIGGRERPLQSSSRRLAAGRGDFGVPDLDSPGQGGVVEPRAAATRRLTAHEPRKLKSPRGKSGCGGRRLPTWAL